jgi:GrpB-like predicted nucleotidyltransferase (UPF0157 family)
MKIIRIVDHDPSWPAAFEVEKAGLTARLGEIVREVHHVGSTAVPGLAAKPKIDIDAVLHWEQHLAAAIELLTADGSHTYHGDPFGDRMWTFTASRVSHGIRLYLCEPGNRTHLERVLFRDWLRSHGDEAAAYAALKRRLASQAAGDWKAYTDGKAEFVARIVARASRKTPAAETLIPPASTSAR